MSALTNLIHLIGNTFVRKPAPPPARDLQRLRCRKCHSEDVWRVRNKGSLYSDFMSLRKRKPFQCRRCSYRFYFRGWRKDDQ